MKPIIMNKHKHKQSTLRYEYINDVILDHLDDEIKSTDRSGVWRYLISFKVPAVRMIWRNTIFLERWNIFNVCPLHPRIFCVQLRTLELFLCTGFAISARASSPSRTLSSEPRKRIPCPHLILSTFDIVQVCGNVVLSRYVEHDTLIWEYLNSSIHLVADDIKHIWHMVWAYQTYDGVGDDHRSGSVCHRNHNTLYTISGGLGDFQESSGWLVTPSPPKEWHRCWSDIDEMKIILSSQAPYLEQKFKKIYQGDAYKYEY